MDLLLITYLLISIVILAFTFEFPKGVTLINTVIVMLLIIQFNLYYIRIVLPINVFIFGILLMYSFDEHLIHSSVNRKILKSLESKKRKSRYSPDEKSVLLLDEKGVQIECYIGDVVLDYHNDEEYTITDIIDEEIIKVKSKFSSPISKNISNFYVKST